MGRLRLGVNIDHVATIRQQRHTKYPDPVLAALLAEEAGADGITVHLREDRRHIQERDVTTLIDVVQTRINLEMAASEAMLVFATRVTPACCCLVPERREELTTEGGLDVLSQLPRIKDACARLAEAHIQVSLFIEPSRAQVDAAHAAGAPTIELHTGRYADAASEEALMGEFEKILDAARYAKTLGLRVNAGHGLHYKNVHSIAKQPEFHELNIGHSIVARAFFVGFESAVREMKQLMHAARQ